MRTAREMGTEAESEIGMIGIGIESVTIILVGTSITGIVTKKKGDLERKRTEIDANAVGGMIPLAMCHVDRVCATIKGTSSVGATIPAKARKNVRPLMRRKRDGTEFQRTGRSSGRHTSANAVPSTAEWHPSLSLSRGRRRRSSRRTASRVLGVLALRTAFAPFLRRKRCLVGPQEQQQQHHHHPP
jgi:hypothetical protein